MNAAETTRPGAYLDHVWMKALVATVALLIAANVALIATGGDLWALPQLVGLIARQVDFDRETNFATWVSSMMLLLCALQAFALWRGHRGSERRAALAWFLLAAGFVLLSLDDFVQIHERVERAVRAVLAEWGEIELAFGYLGAAFAATLAAVLALILFGPLLPSVRRTGGGLVIACCALLALSALAEIGLTLIAPGDRGSLRRVEVVLEEGSELAAILVFLTFLRRQLLAMVALEQQPGRG